MYVDGSGNGISAKERWFNMRSSLGFHTLSMGTYIDGDQWRKLRCDLKQYSRDTGEIKMYPVDRKGKSVKISRDSTTENEIVGTRITFCEWGRGIEWTVRRCQWPPKEERYVASRKNEQWYMIDVKINPKLLTGARGYITAATIDDMETAIANFNKESEKLSPILPSFTAYKLKRIDYCANFDLEEVAPGCSPELIMELIKKSEIPARFKEWTTYDDTAHRKTSKPSSFYLGNGSVHINCYSKYMDLLEKSQKQESQGYNPISQKFMESSKNIIRFEVQCKYRKTFRLSADVRMGGDIKANQYESLLDRGTCACIIADYFEKIFGQGDWYSLQEAIRIIRAHGYNRQKEQRLIEALQLVNQCRGVSKAMATLQEGERDAFKRTLRDLSGVRINPVTIPKQRKIKRIRHLLYSYNTMLDAERCIDSHSYEYVCRSLARLGEGFVQRSTCSMEDKPCDRK